MGGTHVTIVTVEGLCSHTNTRFAHGDFRADIPVVAIAIARCEDASTVLTTVRRTGIAVIALKRRSGFTYTVHARILGGACIAIIAGANGHRMCATTVGLAAIGRARITVIAEDIP